MEALGLFLLCTFTAAPALAEPFVQPAGTVPVDFSMDDRLNRIYGSGDLKWKGGFFVDPDTRVLVRDDTWSGGVALEGFPTLYDDGPWTTGGHEPIGAKPGDHVWGVTVFVVPDPAVDQAFQYGVVDAYYEWNYGNGWMWRGPNGEFVVRAGATSGVTAQGQRFEKFGKQDLGFVVDTAALQPPPWGSWDVAWVGVKSSWWGWAVAPMDDAGAGRWTFDLAPWIAGGVLMHTGFMKQGSYAEFVVVLVDGQGNWNEYVFWNFDGANWVPTYPLDGLTARTRCSNLDAWVAQPITFAPWSGNPMVIAPAACAE
jgi:hypothetical protein